MMSEVAIERLFERNALIGRKRRTCGRRQS
jgi:hypothetical protein